MQVGYDKDALLFPPQRPTAAQRQTLAGDLERQTPAARAILGWFGRHGPTVTGAVKQVNNLKSAENGPFAAAEIVGLSIPDRGWIVVVAGCETGPPAEGEHDPDLCGARRVAACASRSVSPRNAAKRFASPNAP
jgi:hypothetical protein